MDWNLLGFSFPGGSTLPVDPISISREEIVETAIKANGSAEYHAYQAGQKNVRAEQSQWRTAVALVLDAITIACIFWLLFYGK